MLPTHIVEWIQTAATCHLREKIEYSHYHLNRYNHLLDPEWARQHGLVYYEPDELREHIKAMEDELARRKRM